VGFLAAIDASVPDGEIRPEDIVGVDAYRRIYYFDHDSALWHDLEGGLPPRENASLKELVLGYDIARSDYGRDPYTAGYHLVDVNPGWIDHVTETREECLWKGLCVHWTSADAVAQYLDDREFEECLDLYPENPTCTAFTGNARFLEDQPASSIECRQAHADNVHGNDCPVGTLDSSEIIVPDEGDPNHGLDQLVTIELGKDLWDAMWGIW